ncbi:MULTISPECIES: transposase [Rhizobium]|uniref:transposase n=1 Tax=Rhizobium TaxID=379 RepID=UPI0010303E9C|nr:MULTISPECIES: transposase [Rhizobium]TAX50979.1 transposase [Rhizobium leguminosarum]TBE06451.1 transposase [Rhizobium ruizarguesonis]
MSLTDAMMKQFGIDALKQAMTRREAYPLLDALKDEIIELKNRLDAIESHGVKYAGVYQKALAYRRGMVVTSSGAMWVALADTPEGVAPGSNGAFWQLSAKAARPVVRVKTRREE